jgi:hypothetical protein
MMSLHRQPRCCSSF